MVNLSISSSDRHISAPIDASLCDDQHVLCHFLPKGKLFAIELSNFTSCVGCWSHSSFWRCLLAWSFPSRFFLYWCCLGRFQDHSNTTCVLCLGRLMWNKFMDLVGRNKQDVLSKQDVQRMRVKDSYKISARETILFKSNQTSLQDWVPLIYA